MQDVNENKNTARSNIRYIKNEFITKLIVIVTEFFERRGLLYNTGTLFGQERVRRLISMGELFLSVRICFVWALRGDGVG